MYNQKIHLNVENPAYPLPGLRLGAGSFGRLLPIGVPTGFTALLVATLPDEPDPIAFQSDESEAGEISIELGGWAFPDAGEYPYEIVCRSEDGTSGFSCGKGRLEVFASATSAEIPTPPPPVQPIQYITDPVTGLNYRLIAKINGLGQIVSSPEQTPMETES